MVFRSGSDYCHHACTSSHGNMLSTLDNPAVMDEYLQRELSEGNIAEIGDLPSLQVSPFGVIPKRHSSNKWCLIVDLSSPKGSSINDGISRDWCSLTYVSINTIVDQVLALGRGTKMAKMDVNSAYRLVPVHPADCPLLRMRWRNCLFVNKMLLFRLRSAPKIFNAVADALEWVIKQRGVAHVYHYLDDFITLGEPGADTCSKNLQFILDVCRELGVTVALEKCAGPAVCTVFLGIKLDSERLEMQLPRDKLDQL